ncbi:MAG: hypothetical protein RIK87_29535 [Fuerstiella sp.]
MSEVRLNRGGAPKHSGTLAGQNQAARDGKSEPQPSLLEHFLNSFFQEKNIKWMLVVGATIVFASSLMLVTKAWPSWPGTLKYLTILGYTSATFGAAEFGRRRLGLQATWKVLHSLTLLLLPVCFLSLTWLSSGTGVQGVLRKVEVLGLMIPATAFLWYASSRILDHLLRERQTTFLISYQLLCMAGAMPVLSSAPTAFAFIALCWVVFTAGVVKVNRHAFWLAEEHRWPRVFGFLPIVLLGVQFLILAATKTISLTDGTLASAIPQHWLGFCVVMVSATILVTARTIADVFRQRTGNLVRPLPWNIAIPLFCGLVTAAAGVAVSFSGFSFVGPTTYAVIPTTLVAAFLMWLAARDTRHAGFVWASLICVTIAYQCSPTLFADVVRQLKQGVAVAIHEPRLPVAFYGLTYLPLLLIVAVAGRQFERLSEVTFGRSMKHFVTALTVILFAAAFSHTKALFFVSLVNIPMFCILAILFADRRYVLPGIGALILATGTAIPALNGMRLTALSTDYMATALAGLATLLTATRVPDLLLNRIPVSGNSLLRQRDPETDRLTGRSLLLQRPDGTDKALCQLTGCLLAVLTAVHWTGHAVLHFHAPLTTPSLVQYVFLLTAFFIYTLRNPHYLSGLCIWLMVGFAMLRWAAGLHTAPLELLSAASLITAGTSLAGYLWLRLSGRLGASGALNDVRRTLGLDARAGRIVTVEASSPGGWMRQTQAIVVPLCDLSLLILSCLAAIVHLPLLLQTHEVVLNGSVEHGSVLLSTTVTVLWLVIATIIFRSRVAGIAAAVAIPLWVTATLISVGIPMTASWLPVAWTVVQAAFYIICETAHRRRGTSPVVSAVSQVSEIWLQGILILSCLAFDLPLRLAAAIALGCFVWSDWKQLNDMRRSYLAVMANIHVLLLAAACGGASGLIVNLLIPGTAGPVVPFVFLTAALSLNILESQINRFDLIVMRTWTAMLRAALVMLAVLSLAGQSYPAFLQAVMVAGFVAAAAAEIAQAVRRQLEFHVWVACAVAAMTAMFLFNQELIHFGQGISQFVLLGAASAALVTSRLSERHARLVVARRPMRLVGQSLPALVAAMAVLREAAGLSSFAQSANSFALMLAAGIYFQQAMVTRNRWFAILAAAILNLALMLLWWSMQLVRLEFYLVPIGLTILGFVELLKKDLPESSHDPLRYIGALTILVSPMFEVFGGDWLPMITLMVLSVVIILLSIGLRLRALVYTGFAFLMADLVAMILRSRIDYPFVPWLCGIALGVGVIAFAAFCENHREKVLAKIRVLSAELATWK